MHTRPSRLLGSIAISLKVPPGCQVVDFNNFFLMPGLMDLHAHSVESDAYLLLDVANGVTSVREMAGFPDHGIPQEGELERKSGT